MYMSEKDPMQDLHIRAVYYPIWKDKKPEGPHPDQVQIIRINEFGDEIHSVAEDQELMWSLLPYLAERLVRTMEDV